MAAWRSGEPSARSVVETVVIKLAGEQAQATLPDLFHPSPDHKKNKSGKVT
jgi:hypothetical protein